MESYKQNNLLGEPSFAFVFMNTSLFLQLQRIH